MARGDSTTGWRKLLAMMVHLSLLAAAADEEPRESNWGAITIAARSSADRFSNLGQMSQPCS